MCGLLCDFVSFWCWLGRTFGLVCLLCLLIVLFFVCFVCLCWFYCCFVWVGFAVLGLLALILLFDFIWCTGRRFNSIVRYRFTWFFYCAY